MSKVRMNGVYVSVRMCVSIGGGKGGLACCRISTLTIYFGNIWEHYMKLEKNSEHVLLFQTVNLDHL